MKKAVFVTLFFMVLSFGASAQCYDSTKTLLSSNAYGNFFKNGGFCGALGIPRDTLRLAVRDSGSIAWKNGVIYSFNGRSWVAAGGGGSSIISTNNYNTYTIPFASTSFTDSTLVAQYTGGSVTNYFNQGLWLNGTYTGSIDNSRLVAWNYGHLISQEFSQRLVFQVGDSSTALKIGIGVKSNETISPNVNQTNYIDATVGGSGSLINTCNGQTVTTTGLTVSYGDFIELQSIQQADSVTVYFRNMTTGASVMAKRKAGNSTLNEYVSLIGYPTIYFAKGNVRLISYSIEKPDFDYVVLGNSIAAGYRAGVYDSSYVNQLRAYTPGSINNMSRAAAVTADYLQVKDNFNFYNKNVIVSGLFGNDPYSGISDAQIKANYATIIARLRAKGNKITHVDNTYRGSFLGSGGWAQLDALNRWIDTAYGGIDTIVHVNTLLNGGDYASGDPTHPNLSGNIKIANKILNDAPNLFPMLTAARATSVDTSYYKPTVRDTSGREFTVSWNNFGSGGGSGTVDYGTINQLAYYYGSSNQVGGLPAITGSRALVSNLNGLPVAATTTSTEIGYVNGVTSSIQTQLNGKFTLPSLTAGSVLFSNGTTIAQDNSNFFWDNTQKQLGVGTGTPSTFVGQTGITGGLFNIKNNTNYARLYAQGNGALFALADLTAGSNIKQFQFRSYQGVATIEGVNDVGSALTFNMMAFDLSNGRVGINNTSPTEILDVSGNIKASGSVSANNYITTSDKRYKMNIQPVNNGLAAIMRLKPSTYYYNHAAFPQKNFSRGVQYGFIAQDVKQVLPAVVTTYKDGYMGINYQEIIPVLVKAIQEQQQQIDELKKQLKNGTTSN